MKNCQCNHEIPTEGSGRMSRFLKALDPDFAKIDARNLVDMVNFAKKYAQQIRFYKLNLDQCQEESWKLFFKNDLTVLASSVASFDLAQLQKDFLETRTAFEENPSLDLFRALFNPILGICRQLNKWQSRSIVEFPLHTDIDLAIRSVLRKQILDVLVLDKTAMLVNSGNELALDLDFLDDITWDLDNTNILIKPELYAGASLDEQLFKASLEVDVIFNVCFGVISDIVSKTDDYLLFSLEKFPKHEPHMALFIAFLQLFQLAQEQLNGLTEKHLNYYYQDILHLSEKPAKPDHVNLVFELAKGTAIYSLSKATQLSAGKDELGIDQIYETNRELVLNTAKVKELKNVFIDTIALTQKNTVSVPMGAPSSSAFVTTYQHKFYARPVANSADGFGEDFTDKPGKWHPFGADAVRRMTGCGTIQTLQKNNYGKIGFAIASPQLRLASGERNIAIKIAGLLNKGLQTKHFEVKMTNADGWFALPHKATSGDFVGNTGFEFDDDSILIKLNTGDAAIVNYDTKIHSDFYYPTTEPVLQIIFNQNEYDIDSQLFEDLVLIGNNSFLLTVNVANHTNITIENEQGKQPTDKAFYPFTMMPNNGAVLKISSEEIAAKKGIGNIILVKNWQNGTGVTVSELFKTSGEILVTLNDSTQLSSTFEGVQQLAQASKLNSVSLIYDASISFLNPDKDQFFHVYPFGVAETATNQNSAVNHHLNNVQLAYTERLNVNRAIVYAGNRVLPNFKYGQSLFKLDEEALIADFSKKNTEKKSQESNLLSFVDNSEFKKTFDFKKESDQTALTQLSGARKKGAGLASNLSFLEQNQYSGSKLQQGNLYIGLESLNPQQNLSLLFQIAEGSGMDDDKEVPPIHWSYLSNNYWKPLPSTHIIEDDTFGLQTTGIVLLDIPKDASNQHSLMTNGLHWLCISVDENSHRFPYIISIVAQAVKATFKDNNNAASHYQNALPANSVSKIINKPAEIKKVEQPFQTTGAIPAEKGNAFWIRASERLRHKERAITPNDYEKLILANFPDIFKVKCISHKDPNCNCRNIELVDNVIKYVEKPKDSASAASNLKLLKPLSRAEEKKLANQPNGAAVAVGEATSEAPSPLPAEEVVVESGNNKAGKTDFLALAKTNKTDLQKIADLLVCCQAQIAPANVMIVPISNLKNRNSVDVLQARTSRRVLLEIERFLQKKASPFVKIHARNPIYEEILSGFRVKFKPGIDKGHYLKVLNDDLQKYLTPWVFSEAIDVPFTGKVYASAVINFIEKRPYVDYIKDFMMFEVKCNCCNHTFLSGLEQLIKSYLLKEPEPIFDFEEAEGVWDFIHSETQNVIEIAERLILNWNKYSVSEQELLLELIKWYIKKVTELGFSDPLGTLKAFPDFNMTTMAEPSEARSILVTAKQHIILVEEDLPADNCNCAKKPTYKTAPIAQPISEDSNEKLLKEIREKGNNK